ERYSPQRPMAHVDQVSTRRAAGWDVPAEVPALDQNLRFGIVERNGLDRAIVPICAEDSIAENHRLRAWQHLGHALPDASGMRKQWSWIAAVLRHDGELTRVLQRRNDHSIFAPAGAAEIRSVTQCDCLAAGNRNLFQLALGAEANPVSVGRKERVVRA